MQNQHPEQHDRIDRFPAGAALPHLLRRQHDRLNVVPKALPRHQPINGFEWIALRRQRRQPLVCVEKSKLTHPSLPNHSIADETHTDRGEDAIFRGAHKPNIVDALGKDWFDVKEGEASIFKPEGGKYRLVARVQMEDWPRLAVGTN